MEVMGERVSLCLEEKERKKQNKWEEKSAIMQDMFCPKV